MTNLKTGLHNFTYKNEVLSSLVQLAIKPICQEKRSCPLFRKLTI